MIRPGWSRLAWQPSAVARQTPRPRHTSGWSIDGALCNYSKGATKLRTVLASCTVRCSQFCHGEGLVEKLTDPVRTSDFRVLGLIWSSWLPDLWFSVRSKAEKLADSSSIHTGTFNRSAHVGHRGTSRTMRGRRPAGTPAV